MKKVNFKRLGKVVFRMINKSFWKEGNDKLSEKAYMRLSEMAWKTFIEVFCSAADNDKCLNEICRKTPAEGFNSKEYSGYIADMIYEHVRKYLPAENESVNGTADKVLCPPEMTVVEDIDYVEDVDSDSVERESVEHLLHVMDAAFDIMEKVFDCAILSGYNDNLSDSMFDTDAGTDSAVEIMKQYLDRCLFDNVKDDGFDGYEEDSEETAENNLNEATITKHAPLPEVTGVPHRSKFFDHFYSFLGEKLGDKRSFHKIYSYREFKEDVLGCSADKYISKRGSDMVYELNKCIDTLVRQINRYTCLVVNVSKKNRGGRHTYRLAVSRSRRKSQEK